MFFETYMDHVNDADEGLNDDKMSFKSKMSNTTKALSDSYKNKGGKSGGGKGEGHRFSALYLGQWEKNDSWKYVDIWYLVKMGLPSSLRSTIWKDFLRKQTHES